MREGEGKNMGKEEGLGKQSIWDNFTNLYPVQKTLRFELVPVGKTAENIVENEIINAEWKDGSNTPFGHDAVRAENYKIAKQLMNQMHCLFIDQALSVDNIRAFEKEDQKLSTSKKTVPSWKELLNAHYENWKKLRNGAKKDSEKLKKDLEKSKSELYKKFAKLLNYTGAEWKGNLIGYWKKKYPENKLKINSNGIEVLFKNTSDPILLLRSLIEQNQIKLKKESGLDFSQEEMLDKIKTFEKFGTYFSGFNQNRANVYNTDGEISTSLAYRLFDQNLDFFFSNIERWETFKKSIEESKVELKQKSWDNKTKIEEIYTNLSGPRFNLKLEKLLQPESFLEFFNQSGIDNFNAVIGGLPARVKQEKIQGLNEIINLTRQKVSNADKKKFPSLQILYKQILSDKKGSFIDQFEDEQEMILAIKEFHQDWNTVKIRNSQVNDKSDAINYLRNIFSYSFNSIDSDPDLMNGFFLGEKAIQELSIDILGGYNTIHKVWYAEVESLVKDGGKPIPKKDQEKLKKKKFFSYSEVEGLVSKFIKDNLNTDTKNAKDSLPYKKEWQEKLTEKFSLKAYIDEKLKRIIVGHIEGKYSQIIEREIFDKNGKKVNSEYKVPSLLTSSENNDFKTILSYCKYIGKKEDSVETIKEYLDSSLQLTKFVESFLIPEKEIQDELENLELLNSSSEFQSIISDWLTNQFDMVFLYNKVRNFVTKKPGSTDKIKVNFENATLLDGWDVEKEAANYGFLLKKGDFYYLGVADSSFNTELKYFDSENRNKNIKETNAEIDKQKSKKKQDSEKITELTEYLKELESINAGKGRFYQKVRYKFMPDVAKMIPKCTTQTKDVKNHFKTNLSPYVLKPENTKSKFGTPLKVSKEIFLLNNKVYDKNQKKFVLKQVEPGEDEPKGVKKFQKEYFNLTQDEKGYREALEKWIDFCKEFTVTYGSCKNFDYSLVKKTKLYEQLDEFYKDLNSVGYVIDFVDISEEYINKKVDEGKLYLFKIHNKDFSPHKKNKDSKDNLHTSYWKMLFDSENLKDVVLKLNGQAEIFFRPASIERKKGDKATHQANEPITNKNPLATKKHSTFKYDLIKDKRFTQNKFLFHCPITLNFKAEGNPYINSEIQNALAKNPDVNIIGIDRGEKHLLYFTVINQEGEILDSGSLNTIKSEYKDDKGDKVPFEAPYHRILDKKESDRKDARVSWKEIDSIKDLKAGYLSHVVHKLANLIVEHNAIVVLEDLNFGFKRGRFKVEKQVYQKFEKALIEKLNYLVFKDRKDPREPGGFLNAYQLTDQFKSFEKLGKQSGILFYNTASYTSKVDPVTGFMQNYYTLFDPAKANQFLSIFESIVYNGSFFEIIYNLDKNSNEKESNHFKSKWTVGSCVNRSEYNSDKKTQSCFNVNERLEQLFKKYEISYKKGDDILDKIKAQDTKFLKDFHYYFMAIQKMRVVDPNEEKGDDFNDYIQSPTAPFYDSRSVAISKTELKKLPENGDANGAYNIARKGIILLDKINLRVQIEKLFKQDTDKRMEWHNAKSIIPKLSDQKTVFTLFEEWARMTNKGKVEKKDYMDGSKLGEKNEEFIAFLSNLKVSKHEWEIYTQNDDTVKRQEKVWEKISKP